MLCRSELLNASVIAAAFLLTAVFPRPVLAAAPTPDLHFRTASTDPNAGPRLAASYARLPLSFEPNQGQTGHPVKFLSRGAGYTLFLTGREAVLELSKRGAPQATLPGKQSPSLPDALAQPSGRVASAVLRTRLLNATSQPALSGEDELPGKSNYFIGNDPSRWRTNVPEYGKVRYRGVYPGIDLLYYGNQRQLEYDFVVSPGASPETIALEISGARSARVSPAGDLALDTPAGVVKWHKPTVYQLVDGRRQSVACRYALDTVGSARRQRLRFRVGRYNVTRPLIIDPVLAYSTYLGGSGSDDHGFGGIAVDSSGSAYVTGETQSSDFPTQNPFQAALKGASNAFVAKLSPDGSALLYSTYLGGDGSDAGLGIAVDSSGSAYVTGATSSPNFPTRNPLQASFGRGAGDAFVAKLDPTGSALVYSTFLGGTNYEYGDGIAVDSSGSAYVTGFTDSLNFPTRNPLQASLNGGIQASLNGISDLFVAKLSPAGSALVYSTYLGGSGNEIANGIALDSSDSAYVTGYTASTDFPTQNPFQAALKGTNNAFVTKLNPAGSALVYSTYLGGNAQDFGQAIAVDSSGSAYVTGFTSSPNFPTQVPLQAAFGGGAFDAFAAKLSPSGSALVYSTYLGGSSDDRGHGVAVDSSGNAYVTGQTYSTNFPTQDPLQVSLNGPSDAFVAKLNPAGAALVYSTYLGGRQDDEGVGIAIDASGSAYVTGMTASPDFPTRNPFQAALKGSMSAFVTKISLPFNPPVISLQPANQSVIAGSSAVFTAAATGAPSPTVQWQVSADGGANFSNISGATSDTYSFTAALSDSGKEYRAVFTNSAGIATSSAASLTVAPAPAVTATSLFSSINPSVYGQPLTFTAAVTSPGATPTGTVTFNDGGAVLATASLSNGQAAFVTSTLSVGTHSITAVYAGNSAFASSTSPTLAQVVKDAPPPPPTAIHTFTGTGWHLISSPYTISQTFAALSIDAFAYDAGSQLYIVTPNPPADTFHIGTGYWIYLRTASLDIPGPGTPTDNTQPFPVALGPGWNLVGDPITAPVALSTISVRDSTGATMPYTTALANHVVSNLFTYNVSTQSYQVLGSATDTLNPWDGAWIYSRQTGTTIVFNSAGVR